MKLEEVVKNLISKNKISTQTDLAERLKMANKSVTQSNLSRVLKKINAVKKQDDKGHDYYVLEKELVKADDLISSLVFSIEDNNDNIVVTTYHGAASLIGQIIEEAKFESVMGIVPGWNNIIIIPRNILKIKTLKNEIIRLLNQ
jgi:transcriptional regulator of arginine metabolism